MCYGNPQYVRTTFWVGNNVQISTFDCFLGELLLLKRKKNLAMFFNSGRIVNQEITPQR
jgi:hypothetical protein